MQDAEIKKDKIFSDLNKTVELINILRNNTLKRLSFLQTAWGASGEGSPGCRSDGRR